MQLLGCGMSFGDVPPLDETCESWGLNHLQQQRFANAWDGWTRWFDLHDRAHIQAVRPETYRWYQGLDGRRPLYQWTVDPGIPCSTVYPLERVLAIGDDDFGGSVSYLLALAMAEGFDVIELFWVGLNDPGHARQIPSLRYWMGIARGRGLTVTIHGDSALKTTRQYGREGVTWFPKKN